jgi:hypothetical protein
MALRVIRVPICWASFFEKGGLPALRLLCPPGLLGDWQS